jgi:GH18 family chitinase
MKRIASFLALCLFAGLTSFCSPMSTSSPTPPEEKSFRIIAYVTDAIVAEVIPYEQLTHINYSFLIPNADGTFAPLNNGWKLEKIVESAHSQNVRVSIAVGGWGWDPQFEALAASPQARALFVKNLVEIVEQYDLDGVDMDWEYPDPGESSQNYLALMTELRAALPDKLISTAVVGSWDEVGQGIPAEVFDIVDYVNVMTYDSPEHGSMAEFEGGINYWSGRGVPKEKLNIGTPFYSRPDEVTYRKLVEFDPSSTQTDTFDYFGVTQHYTGIPTTQAKTRLAMEKAGGIMFWALDHDAMGEYSLLNAIYEEANKGP